MSGAGTGPMLALLALLPVAGCSAPRTDGTATDLSVTQPIPPPSAATLRDRVKILVESGQADEAEQVARDAVASAADPDAFLLLAELLERRERPGEAETCLRQALELFSEATPLHRALAALYGQRGHRSAQIGELRQAILLEGGDPHASVAVAELLARGGWRDRRRAGMIVARKLASAPDDPGALVLSARLKMGAAPPAWRSAETDLRHALAIRPGHSETIALLGTLYLKTDRPDAAAEVLDDALARHPHHRDLLLVRAQTHVQQRSYREGAALLEPLVQTAPRDVEALLTLVEAWRASDQTERAIELLESRAVEGPAATLQVFSRLVAFKSIAGQLADLPGLASDRRRASPTDYVSQVIVAQAILQASTAADTALLPAVRQMLAEIPEGVPAFAEAAFLQGQCAQRQRDYADADRWYGKARALAPTRIDIVIAHALLTCEDLQNGGTALRILKPYLGSADEHPALRQAYGVVLFHVGRFDEAVRQLRPLIESADLKPPLRASALFHAGRALLRQGGDRDTIHAYLRQAAADNESSGGLSDAERAETHRLLAQWPPP